jgi:hypothetical protein
MGTSSLKVQQQSAVCVPMHRQEGQTWQTASHPGQALC